MAVNTPPMIYEPERWSFITEKHNQQLPSITMIEMETWAVHRFHYPEAILNERWQNRLETSLHLELKDLLSLHWLILASLRQGELGRPFKIRNKPPMKLKSIPRKLLFQNIVIEQLVRGMIRFLQELPSQEERFTFLSMHDNIFKFEFLINEEGRDMAVATDSVLPFVMFDPADYENLELFEFDYQTQSFSMNPFLMPVRPHPRVGENLLEVRDQKMETDDNYTDLHRKGCKCNKKQFVWPMGMQVYLAAYYYQQYLEQTVVPFIEENYFTSAVYEEEPRRPIRIMTQRVWKVLQYEMKRREKLFKLRQESKENGVTAVPMFETPDIEDLGSQYIPACVAAMETRLQDKIHVFKKRRGTLHLNYGERFIYTQANIAAMGRHQKVVDRIVDNISKCGDEYSSRESEMQSFKETTKQMVFSKNYDPISCKKVPICPYLLWGKNEESSDQEISAILKRMGFEDEDTRNAVKSNLRKYLFESKIPPESVCARMSHYQLAYQNIPHDVIAQKGMDVVVSPIRYINQMKEIVLANKK